MDQVSINSLVNMLCTYSTIVLGGHNFMRSNVNQIVIIENRFKFVHKWIHPSNKTPPQHSFSVTMPLKSLSRMRDENFGISDDSNLS